MKAGKKHSNQGFTLIELMVTVAVVGILSALAIPGFTSSIIKSDIKSCAESFFDEVKRSSVNSTGISNIGIAPRVTPDTDDCSAHVEIDASGSADIDTELLFLNRRVFDTAGTPMTNISYTFTSNRLDQDTNEKNSVSVVVSFNQEPRLWKQRVTF